MQEVLVLRDLRATRPAGPFRKGFARRPGPNVFAELERFDQPTLPPEPRIDLARVDSRERAQLLADPEVEAVTAVMPTRLIEPRASKTPEQAPESAWGIEAIGAQESNLTGAGISVAVLDTGIDRGHPAFAGVAVTERDFSGDGDGDRNGHGTHCAGTIFGRDVDGVQIGVARGVSQALIGKVLDGDGRGTSKMLFEGLQWASAQGASVISMSIGFDFPGMVGRLTQEGWPTELAASSALEAYRGNLRMFDALMAMMRASEAFGSGTVVVAAAGNESRRDLHPDYTIAASLPAAAEGVMSVGAAQQGLEGLQIGSFSNTFPRIAAPGVEIVSARAGGGLEAMTGTSMACPHVAGAATLWWDAVRSQGLPPRAEVVVAKVLAEARPDVFAAGVSVADRGTGLVTVPAGA